MGVYLSNYGVCCSSLASSNLLPIRICFGSHGSNCGHYRNEWNVSSAPVACILGRVSTKWRFKLMFLISRIKSKAPQTFTTLLVFALAAGVLGGVLIYVDTSGPQVLEEITGEFEIDMQLVCNPAFYTDNEFSLSEIEEIVQEQEGVGQAAQITVLEIYDRYGSIPGKWSAIMGVNDSFFDLFPEAVSLGDGTGDLNDTSCYLQRSLLLYLELDIGDNYSVYYPKSDGSYDEHNFTIAGWFESGLFTRGGGDGAVGDSYLHVITTRNGVNNHFSSYGRDWINGVRDRIIANFVTDSLPQRDLSTFATVLQNAEKRIEQRVHPYATIDQFPLKSAVQEYSTWVSSMRMITLAFSVPTIVMGVMLVRYNADLLSDERRREVGTLKTRGATGWQSFNWILSSALFTGLVGSIGAVVAGAAAALFSGTVREVMVVDLARISASALILQPQSILSVFLFSFVVGFFVAVPAAITALLLPAADARTMIERGESKKVEQIGNPVTETAAAAFSGLLLLILLSTNGSLLEYSSGSGLLSIAIIALLAAFVVSSTRILSRPASTVKAKLMAQIKRPSLLVGARVVSRNILLAKRTEVASIMFVALVFTAGFFSLVSSTTGNIHMRDLYMFQYGADVVVDADPRLGNVTDDILNQIRNIEGVAEASGMMRAMGHVTFWGAWYDYTFFYNLTAIIYGVQPTEFVKSAFLLPYFTYESTPDTAVLRLAEDSTNIITSFKPLLGYDQGALGGEAMIFGNTLSVELRGENQKWVEDCEIVDVMAEGMYRRTDYTTYFPGESPDFEFVVMDLATLHSVFNTSRIDRIYVKLEQGADYEEVMHEIYELAPSSFSSIGSPFEDIDAILESRAGQLVYGTYTLNVVFALLYLTAGATIIASVRMRSFRRQFSILRSLGAGEQSIIRTMLIEITLTVGLAAIAGAIVGGILVFIIKDIPLIYLGLSSSVSWNQLPLTLAIPIHLVAGVLMASFVVAIIVNYIMLVRSLRSNIAEDIQYSD
ncbi:MAG: FtsX-like permease family protein [Candidatus Thorarchaeota archaeon]|nr:FtsX-like permease family protein [Candidatus Thorarchaeota archaeon]